MNKQAMFSSKKDDWSTPVLLFEELNKEFQFNLDPCATPQNAKCNLFYTKKEDGLSKSWKGQRVFCNPPYGREIGKWVKKCASRDADICVMLLPARTDTAWFHDYIYNKAEIRFLRGRIKFGNAENSAPFPSMIVVF